MKKFILLSILACFWLTGESKTIGEIIARIEGKLNVTITCNKTIQDSWSAVSYNLCNDSTATNRYLEILDIEFSKYPKGYFNRIGIKIIILGRNLKFSGQNRAAVPDPYNDSLYLSIDGSYPTVSDVYLIHVMHHELGHCAEYALWKDMFYKWQRWSETNTASFTYLGNGAMAYENTSKNWYAMTHPEKGFLNLYSMTSEEEDRCELLALIMSDEERKFILQYYPVDEILRKKIGIILTMLDELYNTRDTYWRRQLASMVAEK